MVVAIRKLDPSHGSTVPEAVVGGDAASEPLALLPGAPVHIEARFIRLRPLQGRADLQLAGGTFVTVPIGCVSELRVSEQKSGEPK